MAARTLEPILGALLLCAPVGIAHAGIGSDGGQLQPSSGRSGFEEIYSLLQTHCGTCHVRGGAEGPWSLDSPPAADRFPDCLKQPATEQLRCATYHQLTSSPGPEIPAWIRPEEAAASEPYVQACLAEFSFHIGHSLPQGIPEFDCARLLQWIEEGAPY